ncbi:MAG: sugar phosphate isomerase/epimerase [candidate division WOR-3 bacterium]
MKIGFLTAPFRNEPLETVFQFAADHAFDSLELAVGYGHPHLDLEQPDLEKLKRLIERYQVPLSSLAFYTNTTDPDPEVRKRNTEGLRKAIESAAALGVEVVCTLAGHPVPGKSKIQTIEQDCVQVFTPLLEYAAEKGVKIAIENWYATNLQALDHWQRFFEVLPHENLGLNFDPSHLLWQQIDYILAVHLFSPRIFHTHAKDTEVLQHRLAFVGNQGGGWWRYVIPGLGQVRWGEYLASLRRVGFNGVLSIEHEDSALGREEGFLIGKKYLAQFMA